MKIDSIKTLVSVAILAATTTSVWAAGTTAGTNITNTATITYDVGGATQTAIKSAPLGNSTPGTAGTPTTFLVDKKIDLTVTQPAATLSVTPNTTGNVLTFQVTNTGNSKEDFTMTPSAIAGGDFDATGCSVSPATLSALAVDTATNVTVTCDIPNTGTADNGGVVGAGTVADTKTSIVALIAEVTTAGLTNDTALADDPASVQTVFADAAGTDDALRDAKHSAQGTYVVNSADIKVTKTSAIISDPTGQAKPKRIPGAIIEYTITVENPAGGATADNIVISDTLEGNLTFSSCTASGDGIPAGAAGCSNVGNAVTTPTFTLTGGQIATLKIQATVN